MVDELQLSVSEVIGILEKLKQENGDLPVRICYEGLSFPLNISDFGFESKFGKTEKFIRIGDIDE